MAENRFLIGRYIGFLFLLSIMLSACSGLAGDIEIVRTFEPPPTSVPIVEETFENTINLALGASIYAQNCVRCHGMTGLGDGELVQSGQIQNIPNFTDPQTIQDKTLQSWFNTITNGRIEKLMPPWSGSLTAEERWAVALYTYTRSYDEVLVTQGQQVYDTSCAGCHAPDGTGTGDGSALIGLVNLSEANLASALTTHAIDLELDFADTDIQAMMQYTRLLSSEARQLPDPDAIAVVPQITTTEEAVNPQASAEIPQNIGMIRGRIIQGTEGGGTVEGLDAVVHIYDSELREQVAEYTVGADGEYQYHEVILRPDFAYRVTADYDNITYSSPIYVSNPDNGTIEIDVTIYETGAPLEAIEITSRAIQANLSNKGLYIIEVIDMVNTSDRAYIQQNDVNFDEPTSVYFSIPEGAQLQLEHTDPNRILLSNDGRTVYDNVPVLPNTEHYVQFSYLLPINNAQDIELSVDYAITGSIAYFIEASHLDFVSDAFVRVDTRIFNEREYGVYQVQNTPIVGDSLTYSIILDESPLDDNSSVLQIVPRDALALIFVIIGAIFVVIAGILIWRNRNGSPSPNIPVNTSMESLLQQIAQLDDKFDAGNIEKTEYTQQRNTLKEQLRSLMKNQASE